MFPLFTVLQFGFLGQDELLLGQEGIHLQFRIEVEIQIIDAFLLGCYPNDLLGQPGVAHQHRPQGIGKDGIPFDDSLCAILSKITVSIEQMSKGFFVANVQVAHADLISYITKGMWDIHQQNVFLSSNKPLTLLVEGLTDKLILAQAFKVLKDDYKSLKFDIFHCGGADNIPYLLTGLRTTDFKLGNKKIIALFDSDAEGQDCCNRSQVKYSKAKNKKGLYAIVLPKRNATIESFFPTQIFNDAYTDALSENPFNGSVTDFSKNLMVKSKIKLSENCKNFAAQDFEEFRSIFDLLEEINNL